MGHKICFYGEIWLIIPKLSLLLLLIWTTVITNLQFIKISDQKEQEDYGWLVGCFGFNGPLRQYFSLYRAVSQREGEREEKR